MSAAMGLSTDAINRPGLPPEQAKWMLDSMPIAYAVMYLFGTVGSAPVIALLGPWLLRINLPAACRDHEEKQGGTKEFGGASAWHRWEAGAYKVRPDGLVVTLVPLPTGILFRRFVLRLDAVQLWGGIAGAQTMIAVPAAVQEESDIPIATLGYSYTVAIGHILLTIWGSIIAFLLA